MYLAPVFKCNIMITCSCNLEPGVKYSKTGAYRGRHNFFIFAYFWELVRAVSVRQF